MKRTLLTEDQLKQAVDKLEGWKIVRGKLHKEYRFGSFAKAFGFMTSVAISAEAMNHHPEWFNVYDTVRVDLVTHDLSGISTFDIALAQKIDELAAT